MKQQRGMFQEEGIGQASALGHAKEKSNCQCSCCGKRGHTRAVCYFREYSCYKCEKIGHLKKMCHSSKRSKTRILDKQAKEEATEKFSVNEDSNDPSKLEADVLTLTLEVRRGTGPATLSINNTSRHFKPGLMNIKLIFK